MQEELIQQEAPDAELRNTLFSPGAWQTKIDFINHLVLFNNLLIAVLAEKAGGKSSFIRLLQYKLDPQIRSCVINVAPPCNPHALINEITEKLHLKNDADKPISLHDLVTQINERRTPVLLLIDNAQYLPVLLVKEMLNAIQAQKENICFHLCLVSDYSVVATYNQLTSEVFANSIHSIELGTLNELELQTYVTQKVAGNRHMEKVLSGEQLTQLFKMTGGCLSKINAWLDNLKTESATISSKKIEKSRFKQVCVASFAVFMISGFIFAALSKPDRLTALPQYAKASMKQIIHNIKNNVRAHPPMESELASIPLKSEIAWFRDQGVHQLVYNGLPQKQTLAILDEEDLSDMPQGVIDQVVVIPSINIDKAVNISREDEGTSAHQKSVKTEKTIEKTEKTAEKTDNGYTIQLIASHKMSDIHRFTREYNLQGKCAIRQVTRDDDSWYILTTGEFKNLEQANVALQNLSTELLKMRPWVRVTSNLKLIG